MAVTAAHPQKNVVAQLAVTLSWNPNDIPTSLAILLAWAEQSATNARDWYFRAKTPKAAASRAVHRQKHT